MSKQQLKLIGLESPPPKIPPNVNARLREAADAISLVDPVTAKATGFMARALVQASLPYRQPPDDLPVWVRKSNNCVLLIQPGYDTNAAGEAVCIGYPYGTIPRLLLAWMTREVHLTKSRTLVLGESLGKFMEALDMGENRTGGKTGSITRVRNQMRRLFAANIWLAQPGTASQPNSRLNANVAAETHFWWDVEQPRQRGLFQSTVTLSEQFYADVLGHPVPIDMRALRSLRQSPMSLDIYSWLTYRMFNLTEDTLVMWGALQGQFGSETGPKKFKDLFKASLRQVLVVYPQANVTAEREGLILRRSHTSVPRQIRDYWD